MEMKYRCCLLLQMCPLVADAVSDLNPQLKTLNGKTSCLCQTFGGFMNI